MLRLSSFAIERAHARALAQAQKPPERAEDEADAAEKARAAAAEGLSRRWHAISTEPRFTGRDRGAIGGELRRLRPWKRVGAKRALCGPELAGVQAERDGIRDEATELEAECARLKRRVVELESLLASAMNAPAAAPAPKSRFASYVESLESAKAAHSEHNPHDPPRNARGAAWGEPAAQSAVQPPPPPPPTLPLQPAPTTPINRDTSTVVSTRAGPDGHRTCGQRQQRQQRQPAACKGAGWRIAQTRRGERSEPPIRPTDESCTCSATAAIRTASLLAACKKGELVEL